LREDAEDLTQGFVAGLLASGSIARADRDRGRFRTFLLGAFSHYIANYRRGQSAGKRGGGVVMISEIGAAEAELERAAVDHMSPERHYEQSWAKRLLEKVMLRLRDDFESSGRQVVFDALQPHLSGAAGPPGYARLGETLGLSETAVTVTVHRMRKRYGQLLREEIAATVASPEDVDDELRYLLRVVGGGV
jgi:RNA polymerase sigma-70 factor (ECF subfamily)